MDNNKNYYIDYKHLYNTRPEEKDLLSEDKTHLKIRCRFPKTIKKGTYIVSEFGPVTYDAVLEFKALHALKKPLQFCATSGHWEGMPFLLYASNDVIITEKDEEFIQKFLKRYKTMTDKEKIKELEKENKELKEKLLKKEKENSSDNYSSGWDFHWDGRGDYLEARRCFYGDFG